MPKRLKGTGVALVTPFNRDGSVDNRSLRAIVESTIKDGVDFLVALGTTGETPTLTAEEKQKILDIVIEQADGRVPVVCGIGGNSTAEVVQNIQSFDLRKVVAILSVTPYYNKPTQQGLYEHYAAVAKATTKHIILYNVPGRTGCNLLPATVKRLAADFKNIIGIKDASGSIPQVMELIRLLPDSFVVLSGDDDLALAHIALGMKGVISVAANCFAHDFTEMINLSIVHKMDKARKLHYKLLPGINLLFTEGNPAGVKCFLSKMGLCDNVLRLPLVPVSEATEQQIAEFVDKL